MKIPIYTHPLLKICKKKGFSNKLKKRLRSQFQTRIIQILNIITADEEETKSLPATPTETECPDTPTGAPEPSAGLGTTIFQPDN